MNRPDFSVADLGELATVHVADLVEGANAWIEAEGDYWTLQKQSAQSVGANVIAPLPGAPSAGAALARWIRSSALPGAGGSSFEFIFTPGAVQSGNLYGDWAALMAAIAALPNGAMPRIVFTASFTLPLAGMPVGGWFQNRATWASITQQTGAVTVTVPDGVILDMLSMITNGLEVDVHPTTADGCVTFSEQPPPGVWILSVSEGAKLANLGSKAMIVTPGAVLQTYMVFAPDLFPTQSIPPFSTAPFVKGQGSDVIIGSQVDAGPLGGLTDGWLVGTGAALIYQNGIDAKAPLIPGWVGPPPAIVNGTSAVNLNYTPAVPGNWVAPPPTTIQQAVDRLAAAGGVTPVP